MESAQRQFEELIRTNVPLAPMTTLGIGGPASYLAEIASTEDLKAGVEWARARGLPLFALGGGSNIVVADSGFSGLVLRINIRGVETRIEGDEATLTAGAGEEWDGVVANSVMRGLAGFECLSGIPGRVGATPIQNVGAYGQETSETLTAVEALDLESGAIVIDPHDLDSRSVGSFFVNPVVGMDELEHVKERLGERGASQFPVFPISEDRVKLSAAWLIERAGINRGYVIGNVGTSTKHALAIVNRGGGTAREVIELKNLIQKRVLDLFEIVLTTEPVFIGFADYNV